MSYRRGDKVRVNAIYVDGNDGDEIDMYINRMGSNQAGQETYRLQKGPVKGGQENGGVSWGGFTEDDFIKADDRHEKAIEHLQSIPGSVSYRNYIEKRLAADYAIVVSDHIKKMESAMQDFIDKVDRGDAYSVRSYAKFKEVLPDGTKP